MYSIIGKNGFFFSQYEKGKKILKLFSTIGQMKGRKEKKFCSVKKMCRKFASILFYLLFQSKLFGIANEDDKNILSI